MSGTLDLHQRSYRSFLCCAPSLKQAGPPRAISNLRDHVIQRKNTHNAVIDKLFRARNSKSCEAKTSTNSLVESASILVNSLFGGGRVSAWCGTALFNRFLLRERETEMYLRTNFAAVVVFLFLANCANAQIEINELPAPKVVEGEMVVYTWTSSWGLKSDPPKTYPLGIVTHKTKRGAVAAAKAHIAKTAGNGSMAVTHYLIVGEPQVIKKMAARDDDAKKLLERVKFAKEDFEKAKKDAIKTLEEAANRKLGDTIKEYGDMVAKSYERVKEAKKSITGNVGTLTEAKFRDVNALIDQYNREVTSYRSLMGKSYDLGYSTVERVAGDSKTDESKDDVQRKIANTAFRETSKRERFFSGTSGGIYVDETVYVFLADGRYMELRNDRPEKSYKNDELNVHPSSLDKFAKWRWNEQLGLVEVYDIDRAERRGSVVEKVERWEGISRWFKVANGSIVSAYVENGRANIHESATEHKTLGEELTKKAIEVGKNARWFYSPEKLVSPGR